MFRVVMCQICKCYTSAGIHPVDVEMFSFDLGSCTSFARDFSPILPTGSDGCVYNSVPVQLKVQIVCYERVQTGLAITVPHGG